jgi:hypothetical protein
MQPVHVPQDVPIDGFVHVSEIAAIVDRRMIPILKGLWGCLFDSCLLGISMDYLVAECLGCRSSASGFSGVYLEYYRAQLVYHLMVGVPSLERRKVVGRPARRNLLFDSDQPPATPDIHTEARPEHRQ